LGYFLKNWFNFFSSHLVTLLASLGMTLRCRFGFFEHLRSRTRQDNNVGPILSNDGYELDSTKATAKRELLINKLA